MWTKLAFSAAILTLLSIILTALMSFLGVENYLYIPYLYFIGLALSFFTFL